MISCYLGTLLMTLVGMTDSTRSGVSIGSVCLSRGIWRKWWWEQDINGLGLNRHQKVSIYPLEEVKKHREC